jgi:N6-L-threonylcarbamoyladenine synthase
MRRRALLRGERRASQLLPLTGPEVLRILASFQRAVVSELVGRTLSAAGETQAQSILVSGGVAANSELRRTFLRESERGGVDAFFPSRELSTDNAAMIAAAAYPGWLAGDWAGGTLDAEPVLPLA